VRIHDGAHCAGADGMVVTPHVGLDPCVQLDAIGGARFEALGPTELAQGGTGDRGLDPADGLDEPRQVIFVIDLVEIDTALHVATGAGFQQGRADEEDVPYRIITGREWASDQDLQVGWIGRRIGH